MTVLVADARISPPSDIEEPETNLKRQSFFRHLGLAPFPRRIPSVLDRFASKQSRINRDWIGGEEARRLDLLVSEYL